MNPHQSPSAISPGGQPARPDAGLALAPVAPFVTIAPILIYGVRHRFIAKTRSCFYPLAEAE